MFKFLKKEHSDRNFPKRETICFKKKQIKHNGMHLFLRNVMTVGGFVCTCI